MLKNYIFREFVNQKHARMCKFLVWPLVAFIRFGKRTRTTILSFLAHSLKIDTPESYIVLVFTTKVSKHKTSIIIGIILECEPSAISTIYQSLVQSPFISILLKLKRLLLVPATI